MSELDKKSKFLPETFADRAAVNALCEESERREEDDLFEKAYGRRPLNGGPAPQSL